MVIHKFPLHTKIEKQKWFEKSDLELELFQDLEADDRKAGRESLCLLLSVS